MRMALFGAPILAALGFGATSAVAQLQNTTTLNPKDLRPVASFGSIADQSERSRALFNDQSITPVTAPVAGSSVHHPHRSRLPILIAEIGTTA